MKSSHLLLTLCLTSLAQPQAPIRYEIGFPNAAHHEAEVRATFTGVKQPVLEVVMSRSSPGRYALHEFAKNMYNVKVTDGEGKELPVDRSDPYSWKVSGHKGTVVVEYTLFGDRADGTYDGIDETHAHLNIPATFVWAHGMDKLPISFRFKVPEGSNWKVATQMTPAGDGSYTSPSVDMMMDSPVELSAFEMNEWSVGDRKFRLALHHAGSKEEAAAFANLAKAVTVEAEGVFGAFPRYDAGGPYTFLIDYLPYVNGDGMEHRDSTVITGTRSLKEAGAQNLGTVSHEFFHSWNVERIRPKSLEPFDFERANMSGELWFAEGFTSYYGPLILKRAGLLSIDGLAQSLGGEVNSVLTDPGREIFNVVEMARQAPFVDAATANEPVNFSNTFISYYTYGAALGLGIDLSIRTKFPGKSLDDWMRQMWTEHPDVAKAYTLDDLQTALAHATGDAAFAADIFRKHILGKQPMDYKTLLASAGMLVRKRQGNPVWLGIRYNATEKGLEINSPVLRYSPAYVAGLDRGDKILELDGKVLKTQDEVGKWLEGHKPGDKITLKVESRKGPKDVELVLTESPALEVVTYEKADQPVTKAQLGFREEWLSSKAVHALPEVKKYCPMCRRAHPFEFLNCPYDGAALGIVPGKEDGKAAGSARRGRPAIQ